MSHCRNFDEELNSLRRCGCPHCEEKYYHLRRNYRAINYDYPRAMIMPSIAAPMLFAETSKEPKMEEPKNIAIKILVEKLKAEQGCLSSNETSLKSYEELAKRYREAKNKNQRAIKELASALKKLGHKDS